MPYYKDPLATDAMMPNEEWTPVYWTPMKTKKSLGYDIIAFAEKYFAPPRSMDDARPFRLTNWQRFLLIHMFELNQWGKFRYREFYFFIARKNGKSFLESIIAAYFLFKGKKGDEIYCVAKTSKQARIIFDVTHQNIEASPRLLKVIDTKANEIVNKRTGTVMMPLSGNAGAAHGKATYIGIIDEFHAWDSLTGTSTYATQMIGALKTGSGDRDEYLLNYVTTAGDNDEGKAHEYWEKAIAVASGAIEDDQFGCALWMAEDDDDISDPEVWKKANPNIAEGLLSMEEFAKEWKAAEQLSTNDFERYHLNKWVKNSEKADFITGANWKFAFKPELKKIEKGSDIFIGFDGAITEDSTGWVAIDKRGLIEVLAAWEKDPKNPDWFCDVNEVEAAYHEFEADYNVLKTYMDPSRHQALVNTLQRVYGRGKIRDIPTGIRRMAPMSQEFRTDVYTGKLFHVGERKLTTHVRNAIETINGVPNKEKRNSPKKIDFLAAAILANGAKHEWEDRNSSDTKIRT